MLKVRQFPRKSLKWWVSQQTAIDLEPDFQRTGRVWKDGDRAFLIDSMLNGFDVPKLYVADFTRHNIPQLNRRRKDFAVIDGKQRLTAVFAFFANKLPLSKRFVLETDPKLPLGALKYADLKSDYPSIAKRLEQFKLDVKVIETNDRQKISDVFLRLNKASKALNGAEVRNAMIGRCIEAIRDISAHRFFRQKIRFSTDRSQEKNAAAKILLLEFAGAAVETKKRNLDQFVIDVGNSGSRRFTQTVRRAKSNLEAMARIFKDHDALLGAQGHITLYYSFIARLRATDKKTVRNFLDAFEAQRTKNRNRNRQSQRGDSELDSYDLVSRSTNDKSSIETRLRIIRTKHAQWKKTKRI
jgi:hypothetical protein